MTDVPVRVGIAHPEAGYRAPVDLLRAVIGTAAGRRARRRLLEEWEGRLDGAWSSFCDEACG